jgi:hypothetical protein
MPDGETSGTAWSSSHRRARAYRPFRRHFLSRNVGFRFVLRTGSSKCGKKRLQSYYKAGALPAAALHRPPLPRACPCCRMLHRPLLTERVHTSLADIHASASSTDLGRHMMRQLATCGSITRRCDKEGRQADQGAPT